jgi:ligand-binding SRPBCC domain-containing protein
MRGVRGPIVTSSRLDADAETVWARAATFEGINYEFAGLLRMTAPRDVREAGLDGVKIGERTCRSWILLLGLIPFDYDDITIVELDPPHGFLERSPMLSNRLWEHRRRIEPAGGSCVLTDEIRYEPRLPLPHALLRPIYAAVFALRHRRLRKRFGGRPA